MPTARKTKKKIKGIQQATTGVAQETPENPANKTVVPASLPQVSPTLMSLLEVIEPEVLFAGYDSSLPDSSWRIMSALNMLGGRQVIAAVKWAKALPGKMQKMTQLRCKPLYFAFLCLML